jgi:general secretion pathway protein A
VPNLDTVCRLAPQSVTRSAGDECGYNWDPVTDSPGSGPRPLLDLFPPSPALRPRPAARIDPPTTSETFYGLTGRPFGEFTDPRFFYESSAVERVLQDLGEALRSRRGVALLTGNPGVGKTTVCRAFVRGLDRRTVSSLQIEPFASVDDLLKTVLVDFGVVSRADLARAPQVARGVLLATLRAFLESLVPLQATAVILVDDAQDLAADVLADLVTVVDAGRASGLLQMVLIGAPGIAPLLTAPELRPLAASISVRCELGPLAPAEIMGYVRHRLIVAGSNGRVQFSDVACARLYELSRGVPQVVNLLCERALAHGHQRSASTIDAALVDAAAEEVDVEIPANGVRVMFRAAVITLALVASMMAGAVGAVWVFRDSVSRTIDQWEGVPSPPGGPMLRLPVPLAPIPAPASDNP